jgi:F420-0:gamma-glutamyl ligase-like protein
VRQYTWDEVAGAVYEVYREEIDDLRRLPFSNILTK